MRHFLGVLLFLVAGPACAAEFQPSDIVGTWTGKAKDGTEIKYVFEKDGTQLWFVEEPNFKAAFPQGLKGKYSLKRAQPFWELDITDFEHEKFKGFKFLAIVDPQSGDQVKMDGRPNARPNAFGDEAITLAKSKPKN